MDDNIALELRAIMDNIPSNVSELEKIRWIYVNLGKLISYDYKKMDFKNKVSIKDPYVSKFQTCVQVSDLLNEMIGSIPGLSSVSVEREIDRKYFDEAHRSNVVTLSTGERIVLDLIYDIPLIQSGFQTKNFGYFDDGDINTIIISTFEDKQMDTKLGLNTNYKDEELKKIEFKLRSEDLSSMSFEQRTDYIINQLKPFMSGNSDFVESTNLLDNTLFINTINGFIIRHNILNPNDNERIRVYIISNGEEKVWYIYSNSFKLKKSSEVEVVEFLRQGWFNRSKELYNYVNINSLSFAK